MEDVYPDAAVIIIVPCFNEAGRLGIAKFLDFLAHHPHVQILFVDDGSTDETARVLERLTEANPVAVHVLSMPTNVGKSEAVRCGLLKALDLQPGYVGYWDADLATPLEELPAFLQVFRERPRVVMVLGARVRLLGRSVHRSRLRHYLGRIFATAASWVLQMPVYDTQCGAKVFRVDRTTRDIFTKPFRSRWLLDVEILQRLRRGLGVDRWADTELFYELPLTRWRDVRGSKLSLRQSIGAVFDLCRLASDRSL